MSEPEGGDEGGSELGPGPAGRATKTKLVTASKSKGDGGRVGHLPPGEGGKGECSQVRAGAVLPRKCTVVRREMMRVGLGLLVAGGVCLREPMWSIIGRDFNASSRAPPNVCVGVASSFGLDVFFSGGVGTGEADFRWGY